MRIFLAFSRVIKSLCRRSRAVRSTAVGYLNKMYYELLHRKFAPSGETSTKRKRELIISLTTIPDRLDRVHLCIETLLRQTVKPDRILIWLSPTYSDKSKQSEQTLPPSLIALQKRGLQIHWYSDIRSYRKIIPAIKLYPNALIVTADDDVFYPRTWLEDLYSSFLLESNVIHCHRAHLMRYDSNGTLLPYRDWNINSPTYLGPSLDLFPTGVGGVLYAPWHLSNEVLNETVFIDLCPSADDIWLKAMSLLAKTPCKKVRLGKIKFVDIPFRSKTELSFDKLIRRE